MFDYMRTLTANLYKVKFYGITTKRGKKVKPYIIIIGSIWLEENGFKDIQDYIDSIVTKYKKYKYKCWEYDSPMHDFFDYEGMDD